MSTKQMAHAAVRGSRLTFHIPVFDQPLSGYLVGMDDYHWIVAATYPISEQVVLVHKASAPIVVVGSENDLEDEPDATRQYVSGIGEKFWAYCQSSII